MKRIELPSGAISGLAASATRNAGPPAVRTAHTARSGPSTLAEGFATQPSRFGAEPRTNTTVDPSFEIRTPDRSTPSSFMKLVRRTGAYAGATAAYAFRRPSSKATHARRSTFFAATISRGDAGLKNRW